MSKPISFVEMAKESAAPEELVNKLPEVEFQKLRDRPESSKAELVLVGVRMTKADRRQLKAMAVQLDTPIQEIIREGIALFRAKKGVR